MNKKFSIVTAININKIFEELDNYINQEGYYDLPYLFMSEDTAKTIEKEFGVYSCSYDTQFLSNKNKKNGAYAEFIGYKVYINNDLAYGVIEIR
jgi:hypothetical protein